MAAGAERLDGSIITFEEGVDVTTSEPVVINPTPEGGVGTHRAKVLVLYTGGTLGMKRTEDGSLAPAAGHLVEQMRRMDEIRRDDMPELSVSWFTPLLDSSDMSAREWASIARFVFGNYHSYDGFLILLGTDTMPYCAAGLSFMLENLGKPVILTGSMVPLVDLYTDARRNLIVSILLAAYVDCPEVALFMNDKLWRGNRAVKMDSSSLDAFMSPDMGPLAALGTRIRVFTERFHPQPRHRIRCMPYFNKNVAVMRMVPGGADTYMHAAVMHGNLRGLVLELYGTGNVSLRHSQLLDVILLAVSKGVVVVAASQCVKGGVNLTAYELGAKLARAGVISSVDMTVSTTAVKLGWLLGLPGLSVEDVKRLMQTNLRGELTPEAAVVTLRTSRHLPVLPNGGTIEPTTPGSATPGADAGFSGPPREAQGAQGPRRGLSLEEVELARSARGRRSGSNSVASASTAEGGGGAAARKMLRAAARSRSRGSRRSTGSRKSSGSRKASGLRTGQQGPTGPAAAAGGSGGASASHGRAVRPLTAAELAVGVADPGRRNCSPRAETRRSMVTGDLLGVAAEGSGMQSVRRAFSFGSPGGGRGTGAAVGNSRF